MKTEIFTTAPRSVPLRIRITEDEHKQLKKLSKKVKRPVATLAHALLIKTLEQYQEQ